MNTDRRGSGEGWKSDWWNTTNVPWPEQVEQYTRQKVVVGDSETAQRADEADFSSSSKIKWVLHDDLAPVSIRCMPATGYRYLVKLPNVRGGKTIVDGTRIGVHDVVGLIVNGSGIDDVVRSFPDLTRAQIYECLAYYEDHRGEIDTLIARQMSQGV